MSGVPAAQVDGRPLYQTPRAAFGRAAPPRHSPSAEPYDPTVPRRPDERRGKVEQEIRRPTFVHRDRPLPEMCGFLSFDKLVTTVEGVRKLGVTNALKPDFLQDFPEFFGDEPED